MGMESAHCLPVKVCKDTTRRNNREVLHKDGETIHTLDEVAALLGLSRQRVHEIEKRALNKLREAFLREIPALKYKWNRGGICGLQELDNTSALFHHS
jgi:Sigma-70, region 4